MTLLYSEGQQLPASFDSATLVGSSGIDIVSSVIDNNTVIYFSPDANGASSTLTIEGITDGDLSEVTISSEEGAADTTVTDGGATDSDAVDLSSGTVEATSANDTFEYTVKFVDGSPVALDGNVTIDGFNTNYDKIIIKAELYPCRFHKEFITNCS